MIEDRLPFVCWKILGECRILTDWTLVAMIALLLLTVGAMKAFRSNSLTRAAKRAFWFGPAYVLVCFLWEPFMYMNNREELSRGLFSLLPGLFLLGYFWRLKIWPSFAGMALFVSTAVAMIQFNCSHYLDVIGYFYWETS